MKPSRSTPLCLLVIVQIFIALTGPIITAQPYPPPGITKDGTAIVLEDFLTIPLSSRGGTITNFSPPPKFTTQLTRVNFLRSEPDTVPWALSRFFVNDLNRNLYIVDNAPGASFSVYLNFQAIFPKFDNDPGYAGGLVTLAFDPEYANNGIFYTVHTEDPEISGSGLPIDDNLPGFDPTGYSPTPVIDPPIGEVSRQAVLVEWTDTDISNATFEGTAREILRVGFNEVIHPFGDLIFNPLAQPGDPDYRNLYIASGDGRAGESAVSEDGVPGVTSADRHYLPQRLDTLVGKILRITPDLNLRPEHALSPNGQYRIPSAGSDPNPFVSIGGARGEIYAYGFRNPHRMNWDPESAKLIITDIGHYTFEEVNIIEKGLNYGWASREGTRSFFPTRSGGDYPPGTDTDGLPSPDLIDVRLNASESLGAVTPIYPVAEYFHDQGDAISSGFVYRGTLMPQLYGKFVFGDITTARLFYCDLGEMIAANDGDPATLATIHELQVVRLGVERRLFDIVADTFEGRGGTISSSRLPGSGVAVTRGNDPEGIPYGGGRADIRLAIGGDRELYVLSKSDGMIRRLTEAHLPPDVVPEPPVGLQATAGNARVSLNWAESEFATTYSLYRSTTRGGPYTAIALVLPGTAYSDTAVINGTTYYYVVTASNVSGTSGYSAEVAARPLTLPAAPTSFVGRPLEHASIQLNWSDRSTNELGFRIYRSINATDYQLCGQVGANVKTWKDTGLAYETLYYYAIAAYNGSGESPPARTSVRTYQSPPPPPTGLTGSASQPTVAGTAVVSLAWNATERTSSYRVKQSRTSSGPWRTLLSPTITSASVTKAAGYTYYYAVSGRNIGGEGALCPAIAVTTRSPRPTGVTAVATSPTTAQISWIDQTSDEAGFLVQYYYQGVWVSGGTATAGVTTLTIPGLVSKKSYRFRVSAFKDTVSTGFSTIARLTMP